MKTKKNSTATRNYNAGAIAAIQKAEEIAGGKLEITSFNMKAQQAIFDTAKRFKREKHLEEVYDETRSAMIALAETLEIPGIEESGGITNRGIAFHCLKAARGYLRELALLREKLAED